MAEGLSMAARREITKKFAREYAKVGKAEKSRLLDSLVETTGWTRDHARRAIRHASARVGAARDQERKPRPRKYSYDGLVVLQEVWRLAGQPSGKYLAAVMDDTLGRLVRFGELGKVAARVSEAVLDELRAMSAATIDRYLKPHKDAAYPVALSGTKPSHILRSSIPTRTSMDAPITTPGFLELDTVAHCGHTLKGEFLRTLTATDPLTGWTMLRSIRNNAYVHVHGALEWMTGHTPVPVAGMDFDNAHVEQRNGDWVRRHAFRYRYETPAELALLNELWDLVMARKNHLLPCVKAVDWTHTAAGRKKRVYDKPRTPYQRLLDTDILDDKTRARLQREHAKLNPARITKRINQIQRQLIDLATARTQGTRPAA